jgi:glycosyltransferase involved in cell wall biosynthesis
MLAKPKILIIPAIDWLGGPENRLHRITEEWDEKICVHVFAFPLTGNVKRHSHNVLLKPPTIPSRNTVSFYMLNIVPHAIFIIAALLREKYSLILISHPFYGIPAVVVAKIKRIPLIFDLEDDLVSLARMYSSPLFSPMISLATYISTFFVTATSDVTTTVSKTLANYAARFTSRVLVVPNGVDLKSFMEKNEKPTSRGSNRKIIGYVGGIAPWSGLKETLSEVVPKVLEFDPDVEFHVYGDGPDASAIAQLSKNQHAIKYFGEIPYEEVPRILRTFVIGLIPFLKCSVTDQSCPMKLFEYWASGIPVISMNLDEVKYIGDGAVLLVNNFNEMINGIEALLSNEKMRTRLRSDGLDRVTQYQWSHISERLLEIILLMMRENMKNSNTILARL